MSVHDTSSSLFLLFGCARSGTTSLCRILDSARNACCASEPSPQLHRECRLQWEGKLENAETLHRDTLLTRAESAWLRI